MHYGDMTDASNLLAIMAEVRPDEVYNLAAQSMLLCPLRLPNIRATLMDLGHCDFQSLRTIYQNWDELATRISHDIDDLSVSSRYDAYQKAEYALCAKHYDHSVYSENLRKFFVGEYSYQ